MDHLGLEDDQKEKLRQYTEFTHQHDYDVAVGTLASLNWNLEQAIEAHLMQEDMNDDDDDPEVLETIPAPPRGASNGAGPQRFVEDVMIEPVMPAARGRRRGRTDDASDATTATVDNQVKRLRLDDDQADDTGKANKRGAPVPRRGRAAAEQPSSSAASAPSRRHTRANPAPPEPAQPESARQNGVSRQPPQRAPMNTRNQPAPAVVAAAAAPFQIEDSDDDDDMNIIYDEDDDDMDHEHRHNGHVDNNEVARGNALPTGRIPLIPDGYSSVPDALRNFVTVFADRFCSTPASQAFMPPFYTDVLANALKEAFEHPDAEHRRPLVFYINHDRSIASNIFASQVLCSEAVSSLIRHQYVLFPWDVSTETNLMHFLEFLQANNMGEVRNSMSRLAVNRVESFPLMAIVIRERNTYRLIDYCKGTDTADQVLEKLLSGVNEYSTIRMNEASEKRNREEREAIRNQQEAEYKASLEADQKRMEAKQREIDEQRMEEERKQKEVEDEALRRQLVASTLPDEPPATAPPAEIVNIKFRLPEGGQDMRRFRRCETIQTMIDYLSSKGFCPEKFKYFNSDFPKKEVIRHFDLSVNFTDSKWPAREQIFVEEI